MTKTVWKLEIKLDKPTVLELPKSWDLIHFDTQQDLFFYAWFLVNPLADKEKVEFSIHATGEPVPMSDKYWGTVQTRGYVWHLFQKGGVR